VPASAARVNQTLCYELADDFFNLYEGYTINGKVQENGLISKNKARIGLAHDAPAGALDKVAMEMRAAAGALFTKKDTRGSADAKRHLTR